MEEASIGKEAREMSELEGKAVLVMGAGPGIGQAVALLDAVNAFDPIVFPKAQKPW